METEPHHPSWHWRVELWISTAITLVGTLLARAHEPRLDGAVLMLGVATAVQVVVLVGTYVREGARREREVERSQWREPRDHGE